MFVINVKPPAGVGSLITFETAVSVGLLAALRFY